MKYSLKDVIIFTRVARLKSFAKASSSLGISKSVISSRISELEKQVGLSLLIRNTRDVNLTSDGKIFYDYCLSIIEKVDNLNEFLDSKKDIDGTLKIVIPAYFSRYHIVPYLDEFFKKYPKLKLDITLTENPVNILVEGYDLQIRIQTPEKENLEVTKLMDNEKILCASPKYIEKFGEPKTPDDLKNHNCIVFGENNIWRFKHKISRKITEIHDMRGNIKCDNGEIIKELVLLGMGITVKSIRDAYDEIASGKIITLLNDYEIPHSTQFYAVYPSSKYMSPKVMAFINFFREKLIKR